MLTNLVSLITKSLASTNTASAAKVTAKPLNYNPFSPNQSPNPFMNQSFGSNETMQRIRLFREVILRAITTENQIL